jgi:CSLREA domain-containing protein
MRVSTVPDVPSSGLSRHGRALAVLLCLGLLTALLASRAWATTRVVSNLNDSGLGSLRDTIAAAVAGDTITFSVTGVITLTGGEILIDKPLTISGPGARKLRISGNNAGRVFNIDDGGVNPNVTISGVTLSNGKHVGKSFPTAGLDGQGGAIVNYSVLVLTDCTIRDSTAIGGTGSSDPGRGMGGGIYNTWSLTVLNCTFSGNSAQAGATGTAAAFALGGAIYNAYNTPPMYLFNTTISGNSVVPRHNGAAYGGGIYNEGTVSAWNCTVSGNSVVSPPEGGAFGAKAAGVEQVAGSFTPQNTLIAGNSVAPGPNSMYPDVEGVFTSQGHNFIGVADGSDDGAGGSPWIATDQTGTTGSPLNPSLDSLTDNGGQTDTMALEFGSLAIDKGDDTVVTGPPYLTTDQIGHPRKLGLHVDVGAFERDVPQTGANFVVNTLEDHEDGVCGVTDCTLREAINAANLDEGLNTITFRAGLTGTITLRSDIGELDILFATTVTGLGARALTVSGGGASGVFQVYGGPVNLSGLTIRDGKAAGIKGGPGGGPGGDGFGSGIFNQGNLTVANCALTNNLVVAGTGGDEGGPGGNARGGAVSNLGTLVLNNCTLSGNTAMGGAGDSKANGTPGPGGTGLGGGIYNEGNLYLTNCTLANNLARGGIGGDGAFGGNGGTGLGGGLYNKGTFLLTNSTFNANYAVGGSGGAGNNDFGNGGTGYGGGLFQDGAASGARLRNTLLGGNTAASGADDVAGTVNSGGNNLAGKRDGSSGWVAGDKPSPVNPLLTSLANNGGPTDTCALQNGSPAINGANNSLAPATDQRGYLRPDTADIGAYEYNGQAPVAPVDAGLTPGSGASEPGSARLITTRYTDANGASDLSLAYLLINNTAAGYGALWGYYDPVKNKLYLRNNAGTAWLGGYAPGTAAVISDPAGHGSLDCAKTTVSTAGNTLTVAWSLSANASWNATTQKLFMYVQDKEGLTDGFDAMGTWSISHSPSNGTVSPNSGSSATGAARTLTATYSDPDGATDLTEARIYVSSSLSGAPALQGYYNAGNNRLYLRNAANTAWLGGYGPGTNNVISEAGGPGSLNCAATQATKNGNLLTIAWTFTPAGTFTGTKNLYLYVKDKANLADGWDLVGTWTIQ